MNTKLVAEGTFFAFFWALPLSSCVPLRFSPCFSPA